MKLMPFFCLLGCLIYAGEDTHSQLLQDKKTTTRQDTLRGSNGPGRDWWDVVHYRIELTPDIQAKTIRGKTTIAFKWLQPGPTVPYMQLDLQEPMIIDRVEYKNRSLSFKRDKNVWMIEWPNLDHAREDELIVYFHGAPRVAVNPPWDGGWIWTRDDKNRPWITVACQGLGASSWYPCKDYQGDEPDKGAVFSITVPDTLVAVANGRLTGAVAAGKGLKQYTWTVVNPINNYNIVPYIGKYVNWKETYAGEKGNLDCSYWVLDYNLEKSKKHFGRDVKPMLQCFENWFGPYPFYEDSYKMIETPHLGMEHQSAVAYGNQYKDGYMGMDISGTGWGKKWDYIIIHETGHEWFANNITTKDIADMWVHEGFTTYSEVLFVECQYGKKAADEYCRGLRSGISNTSAVIGPYGVNKEGSSDMYSKGANLLHTLRQLTDDQQFREILRGLNKEFYHSVTTSAAVEQYISKKMGRDLSKVFDQYLRTASIPVLEYQLIQRPGENNYYLKYRWANVIEGFDLPVNFDAGEKTYWVKPGKEYKDLLLEGKAPSTLEINKNLYIQLKNTGS